MTLVVVTLSPAEVAHATHVGLMRMRSSGNTGRNPHRSQAGRDDEHRRRHERLGCMAEAAVAKHLGIPYAGTVNTFHNEPDVGPFEVRATDRANGCLILRDNDPPDRPYVLVTGNPDDPRLTLRGWLFGRDGRRGEWLRDPHGRRPCWMVPQSALLPVPARVSA